MYYTIYKITNQINGKFYIGSHKTKDPNDLYMGSGKYLKHAQEKYGIENFTKEVLFVFETAEEMYAKEAEIVNEDFLATENTYNLKVGGFGGFDYVNKIKTPEDWSRQGKLARANSTGNKNITRTDEWKRNLSNSLKGYAPFLGKKHTTNTKQKISEKLKEASKGYKNSQFNTRWVFSEELKISKKISKNDPLPEGWEEGRKIKF